MPWLHPSQCFSGIKGEGTYADERDPLCSHKVSLNRHECCIVWNSQAPLYPQKYPGRYYYFVHHELQIQRFQFTGFLILRHFFLCTASASWYNRMRISLCIYVFTCKIPEASVLVWMRGTFTFWTFCIASIPGWHRQWCPFLWLPLPWCAGSGSLAGCFFLHGRARARDDVSCSLAR